MALSDLPEKDLTVRIVFEKNLGKGGEESRVTLLRASQLTMIIIMMSIGYLPGLGEFQGGQY